MSILDRITSLGQTEAGKALDLAHRTYQERMGVHQHSGRALVESIAEVCRNHPNLVGIAAGLLVEQILAHEKHLYDEHHHPGLAHEGSAGHVASAAHAAGGHPAHGAHAPPAIHAPGARLPLPVIRLARLKPRKLAFEVFAGLIALKFAAAVARMFRRDHHRDVWFGRAASIHLWSGTFAVYYAAKALKSPKVSAWRNAAVALFATDAIKPLLKPDKHAAPKAPPPLAVSAPALAGAPLAMPPADEPEQDPFKIRDEPIAATPAEPLASFAAPAPVAVEAPPPAPVPVAVQTPAPEPEPVETREPEPALVPA
ncbi:MAG: hypothetical protein WDM92_13955 [Caulobacteraceae bacterium]